MAGNGGTDEFTTDAEQDDGQYIKWVGGGGDDYVHWVYAGWYATWEDGDGATYDFNAGGSNGN